MGGGGGAACMTKAAEITGGGNRDLMWVYIKTRGLNLKLNSQADTLVCPQLQNNHYMINKKNNNFLISIIFHLLYSLL